MNSLSKIISAVLLFSTIACTQVSNTSEKKSFTAMKAEVLSMMDSVSKDIANDPGKWIYYFEDTSAFYMASEGKLVFPNYTAAQNFITDTLSKQIIKVILDWQNINIDSITNNTVAVNTFYHEDLTAVNGSIIHENGYCTAIADRTIAGWKFRNLHWSVSK